MVASPSRSMVKASFFSRIAFTAAMASSTFDPAMNLRAIVSAFPLATFASTRLAKPVSGIQPIPDRTHQGSCARASFKYSRKCRPTSRGSVRYGKVSTKRKSCTFSASLPMVRPMSLSSHQLRENSSGPPRSSRAKMSRPRAWVRGSRAGVIRGSGVVFCIDVEIYVIIIVTIYRGSQSCLTPLNSPRTNMSSR